MDIEGNVPDYSMSSEAPQQAEISNPSTVKKSSRGWLRSLGFGLIWAFTDVVALAAGFVVLGIGFSYCHTVLQTYSTDLLPEGRATAVSGFAFSLFLGGGLGPIAYGMILKYYGIGGLLAATTLGMAVFFIMTLSVIRSPRMQGSR